jgi:uncharacterized membrane protein
MAATANAITEVRSEAISLRWIISAPDDLVWFIGSVISSYALFALYMTGIVPLVPMVAAWALLIDAPHIFGTFSRTYFDRAERRNRSRLLWGSLLFFLVGPLLVWLGAAFVFFFAAALWGYYHIVKQHYGFMVLYKKKNGDLAAIDNALDRLLLLFAFSYPFVAFMALDPQATAQVPQVLHSFVNGLATLLLAGTIVLACAWVGRQFQRVVLHQPLDLPKYLLLTAAIPMHWIVLLTPMPNKPIAIVAILTIYHNLQYHRLIWFHNKKYNPGSAGVPSASAKQDTARSKYGAAELISRRLLYYIAFGLLFGLIYQGPRQYLGYLGLKSHQTIGETTQLSLSVQLGIAFLWGYAFIHYYLDSKIWRVRRDPSVGRALNMS